MPLAHRLDLRGIQQMCVVLAVLVLVFVVASSQATVPAPARVPSARVLADCSLPDQAAHASHTMLTSADSTTTHNRRLQIVTPDLTPIGTDSSTDTATPTGSADVQSLSVTVSATVTVSRSLSPSPIPASLSTTRTATRSRTQSRSTTPTVSRTLSVSASVSASASPCVQCESVSVGNSAGITTGSSATITAIASPVSVSSTVTCTASLSESGTPSPLVTVASTNAASVSAPESATPYALITESASRSATVVSFSSTLSLSVTMTATSSPFAASFEGGTASSKQFFTPLVIIGMFVGGIGTLCLTLLGIEMLRRGKWERSKNVSGAGAGTGANNDVSSTSTGQQVVPVTVIMNHSENETEPQAQADHAMGSQFVVRAQSGGRIRTRTQAHEPAMHTSVMSQASGGDRHVHFAPMEDDCTVPIQVGGACNPGPLPLAVPNFNSSWGRSSPASFSEDAAGHLSRTGSSDGAAQTASDIPFLLIQPRSKSQKHRYVRFTQKFTAAGADKQASVESAGMGAASGNQSIRDARNQADSEGSLEHTGSNVHASASRIRKHRVLDGVLDTVQQSSMSHYTPARRGRRGSQPSGRSDHSFVPGASGRGKAIRRLHRRSSQAQSHSSDNESLDYERSCNKAPSGRPSHPTANSYDMMGRPQLEPIDQPSVDGGYLRQQSGLHQHTGQGRVQQRTSRTKKRFSGVGMQTQRRHGSSNSTHSDGWSSGNPDVSSSAQETESAASSSLGVPVAVGKEVWAKGWAQGHAQASAEAKSKWKRAVQRTHRPAQAVVGGQQSRHQMGAPRGTSVASTGRNQVTRWFIPSAATGPVRVAVSGDRPQPQQVVLQLMLPAESHGVALSDLVGAPRSRAGQRVAKPLSGTEGPAGRIDSESPLRIITPAQGPQAGTSTQARKVPAVLRPQPVPVATRHTTDDVPRHPPSPLAAHLAVGHRYATGASPLATGSNHATAVEYQRRLELEVESPSVRSYLRHELKEELTAMQMRLDAALNARTTMR